MVKIKMDFSEYEAMKENKKLLGKVNDILKNGYGFWNRSELLDIIISIIK